MSRLLLFIPITLTIIISIFLFIFLSKGTDPSKPPSALINEDLPEFELINLFDKNITITKKDMNGKFILINFFASWCVPCKIEHPLFFEIKENIKNLYILGINHKDKYEDANKYLTEDGNPYDFVGIDDNGMVGFEFGVFGLPETFLVDNSGRIIYKYLGPITKEIITNEILPLIK